MPSLSLFLFWGSIAVILGILLLGSYPWYPIRAMYGIQLIRNCENPCIASVWRQNFNVLEAKKNNISLLYAPQGESTGGAGEGAFYTLKKVTRDQAGNYSCSFLDCDFSDCEEISRFLKLSVHCEYCQTQFTVPSDGDLNLNYKIIISLVVV